MARFNYNDSNKTNGNNNSDETPKVKAKHWLNLGYTAQLPNADGELEDVFIGLPFGIPIDTMNEYEPRSTSERELLIAEAKNDLLHWWQAKCAKLAAGESVTLDPTADDFPLEAQLLCVRDREAAAAKATANGNPLLEARKKRFK
jgi:hypothetical protein